MVEEGFPFVGDLEPRELRPVELAQHELSPDGGATPAARRSGGPARDPRGLRDRHALRRRDRHPDHRLAALSRGRARHAPQPPVVRRAPAHRAPARRRRQPGDLVHRRAPRARFRPDARGLRGDRRVDGQHARAALARAWRETSRRARSTAASRRTAPRSPPAPTSGTASSTTTPPGACTERFPLHRSSRIAAGGPIEGGIFKCGLQPVDARDRETASTATGCRAPPSRRASSRSSRAASATGAEGDAGADRRRKRAS